jgi:hypothetical protein
MGGKSGLRTMMCVALSAAAPTLAVAGGFNKPGNILITDQFNNRVIEVSRDGQIVWSFGSGNPSLCNPGAGAVIAPNDAERLAFDLTLIAGTGTAACPDNRVIVVDREGHIVFQYGQAGVAGSGPNQLNVPVFALETPYGTLLITDQANNRVIEVSLQGEIIHQYGPALDGNNTLNNPNSAELTPSGQVLLADENNNRVLELLGGGSSVVLFDIDHGFNTVAFASQLPNNNFLITDSGHNRIVEIANLQQLVFQYHTNLGAGSNPNPNPSGAVQLKDGTFLIADQFNNRVIIVSPQKKILFQYGTTNVAGNGPNQLNAPYSAMSIGDYTGVTVPPGFL